jgi:uncharacterized protein YndB with AHSA1/START domain
VPTNSLELSREYDLPASIVWDALIDEVLVEGWLAAAHIDARVGGEYLLSWMSGLRLDPTTGVITALEPEHRLAIDTDNVGSLEFVLDSLPGGTRGTATHTGRPTSTSSRICSAGIRSTGRPGSVIAATHGRPTCRQLRSGTNCPEQTS